MTRVKPSKVAIMAATLTLAASCKETEVEPGALQVRIYGEPFIEDEIPSTVFADGWTVRFSSFLVNVRDIHANGEPLRGEWVFDLTTPSGGDGHDIGTLQLPSEERPILEFTIAPAIAPEMGNVENTSVERLVAAEAAMLVEGVATRGDESIVFSWPFSTTTVYHDCESDSEVSASQGASSQLTIHADHLFYDDLDLPEPNVAFDLIASADTDGNGEVTVQELQAIDIRTLSAYQVGSRSIDNLWDYMSALSSTVGHIDGEGHCNATEASN